jgi:phosphopentomutase
VLVIDGLGAGAAVDADRFGDAGADTLGHVAAAAGGLRLGALQRLGLGCVAPLPGVAAPARPEAVTGRLAPRSAAVDSTTGHWELMGLITSTPPPVYPAGFPRDVMDAFAAATGRGWIGNAPASGTEIIARLGEEHLRTGALIVYTSADSVFQVAAHEDVVPVAELYACCEAARRILAGPHAVGRVIARPFAGAPGAFARTGRRRDLALAPPRATALDALVAAGGRVEGVGKVGQLFAGRGLTRDRPTADDADGLRAVAALLAEMDAGLVLANLLDLDTRYGHRNDAAGYAGGLLRIDAGLDPLLAALRPGDLLVVTADHGNDPTHPGTDHTREWVPLLAHVAGADHGGARWVGELADVGRTALAWLGVPAPGGLAGTAIPLPAAGLSRPRT